MSHYVEIIKEKEFKVSCSCGWKETRDIKGRNAARYFAFQHLADSFETVPNGE